MLEAFAITPVMARLRLRRVGRLVLTERRGLIGDEDAGTHDDAERSITQQFQSGTHDSSPMELGVSNGDAACRGPVAAGLVQRAAAAISSVIRWRAPKTRP